MTERPESHVDVDIAACLAGDGRAWDRFCDRYAPRVYSVVRRVLSRNTGARGGGPRASCPEDIEEIVQEVFLRLIKDGFRLLATFDPARGSLNAFLACVAESMTRNALRKPTLHTVPLEEAEFLPWNPPPAPVSSPLDIIPEGLLSPREKEVLTLHLGEGLTIQETAQRLGTAPTTVSGHKYRAINRLKKRSALFLKK
jgi:RNA polymerase sigma-70 factor (ECF subfamily)